MKLKKLNTEASIYSNIVVTKKIAGKQAVINCQLDNCSGSRQSLFAISSRFMLSSIFYPSMAFLSIAFSSNFAVSQANADDNIATFSLPNQPNQSTLLVISQSYQTIQTNTTSKKSPNNTKTNIESMSESINSNSPAFINQFNNNQYSNFKVSSLKIKNPSYKKSQPKVVTVNESYTSNTQSYNQDKPDYPAVNAIGATNNQPIDSNNYNEKNYYGQNSYGNDDTSFNSNELNTFSGSSQENQPYSPLNAISPNTLQTFVKVIDLARNKYVKTVSDEELFESAMKGMLKNIDTHAEFLDAESYENLQAFTQDEIAQVGIMAKYDKQVGHWNITDISPDSTADQNGIQKGFFLHQIDGIKLEKLTSQHDVQQLLSGMAGTMVDIVVSDAGRRKKKLTLQRTESTKTAVNIHFDRGIAVIKIPVFQDNTRQQILDTLVALGKPINGVVLDLQDNPGGVVDSAVEIAGLFQKNMPVVQIENREGQRELLTTNDNSHLEDVSVIILQNRYSASAAEILASGIQSNKRGKVIGEISYGKGTVQSVIPIDEEQAIKITVAYYLTADGKQINGVGVNPDITLINDTIGQIDPDDTSISRLMENNLMGSSLIDETISQSLPNMAEQSIQTSDTFSTKIKNTIDIHKKWQEQAVDMLLEENNHTHQFFQETRLTQLAKLNQQNRQLRNSSQSKSKKSIYTDISETEQIQQELDKSINTPNGILLVYPEKP